MMMNASEIWLTILGLTLITLFCRTTFFLLPSRYQLPEPLQRALRYAPACALIAIVTPDLLLTPAGDINLSLHNYRLIGAVLAAGVFYYTRKLWLMIIVGMLVFTVLRLTA